MTGLTEQERAKWRERAPEWNLGESHIIPLLDALEAAEAERDSLFTMLREDQSTIAAHEEREARVRSLAYHWLNYAAQCAEDDHFPRMLWATAGQELRTALDGPSA